MLLRLLSFFSVAAVVGALFVVFAWPVALLVLSGMNAVGCIGFAIVRQLKIAGFAGVTSILIMATLFFTDWGLSSLHPVVRVAWPYLIAACAAELTTVLFYLLSPLPSPLSPLP